MTNLLRGLSTIRYEALDHEAAKRWYSELLGTPPYFERPGYCEFRLGDFQHELGLMDSSFRGMVGGASASAPGGAVAYWHVDDLDGAIARFLAMGARVHEPVRKFGEGFIAAAMLDPFGNVVGLMYNQHYADIAAARAA